MYCQQQSPKSWYFCHFIYLFALPPISIIFFNQIFDFTSDLSKSNVLLSLRSFLVISMSWLSESLSFQNSEISQICLTSSEILEAKRNCQIVSWNWIHKVSHWTQSQSKNKTAKGGKCRNQLIKLKSVQLYTLVLFTIIITWIGRFSLMCVSAFKAVQSCLSMR